MKCRVFSSLEEANIYLEHRKFTDVVIQYSFQINEQGEVVERFFIIER